MNDFLISLKEALPVLATIFIAVVALIILTRIIFTILFHFAKMRYNKLKEEIKKISAVKHFNKEDEELLRKLDEIPKAHSATRADKIGKMPSSESYELIPSQEQELSKQELNEVNIVDIVKPVGFWTSVILGQKLTYLIQSAKIINERGRQGFWVSMIEAQERAAGRERGRMR